MKLGRPRTISEEAERRIYEIRALGLANKRIAIQLTEENVATARGGAWHASTVSRLLNRDKAVA
ncbi:recombinase family protein [Demequina sediminicola]|uniref:recombinase family protein n=1 Tax=Demequina sediminicola TaxID=1095026 RepID=UPI0022A9DBFD|nr:recombinase family protein [Demequina sediminicola]